MSSATLVPQTESAVGESYVTKRSIVLMSAYLVLLCCGLLYCLAALWPHRVPLAITSVKPDHASAQGGTEVDVVGTGFSEGMQAFLGDVPAKSVARTSDSLLTLTTPANTEGDVALELDSADGHKTIWAKKFVVGERAPNTQPSTAPPPSIPDTSLVNCQKSSWWLFGWACSLDSEVRLLLVVILVGTLGSLIHVLRSFYWYVGNRNLKESWLLMYFLLPINGGGLALMFYLIAKGVSSSQPPAIQSSVVGYAALAALVGMFSQQALIKLKQIAESIFSPAEKGKDQATIQAAPKIVSIQPTDGYSSGGRKVTITGTGFSAASRLTFGGIPASTMKVDGDTQITATAPTHPAGAVDVEVACPAGQKFCLPRAFTYKDLNVSAVAPSSGLAAGREQITIRGQGFEPGISVKVGTAPASAVSVIDANSISATTPSGTQGPADIEVTTPEGATATMPAGFTFN